MAYVPYDPNRPKQKTKDLNAQDIDTYKDAEEQKGRFVKQTQGASEEYSHIGSNPYSAKRAMPSTRQASTSMPKAKPVTSPRISSKIDMPKNTSIPVKAPVDNSGPKGAASTADSGAGTAFAKQYADNKIAQGLKDLAVTETRSRGNDKYKNAHDFKGDTSLDLNNPKNKSDVVSAPKAKPVVKAAHKVKSQFERMQDAYEGFGKGSDSAANKEVQARLEQRSASTRFANPEKTSTGAGAAFAKGAKGAMKKGGSACKGYAKGGSVRSASSRGDGCATKGHTKGAMR